MRSEYRIVVERDLQMRARDGVTLVSDVHRPDADGKFPALVLRTPYNKANAADQTEASFFVPKGYVVVVQDVRGLWKSDGEFYPKVSDGSDGFDTIEWVAALPWCNGKVGMLGQSYVAYTQLAAASKRPPHLRAISPVAGSAALNRSRGGILDFGWALPYYLNMARVLVKRKGLSERYRPLFERWLVNPKAPFSLVTDEGYRHLPLRDWGEWFGDVAPFLKDLFDLEPDNALWREHDFALHPESFAVPALHVGSWYDAFLPDTIAMFTGLRDHARTDNARCGQKILVGPWAHLFPFAKPTSGGTGEIDFGPEAAISLHEYQLPWLERELKGIKPSDEETPRVRIFVMGTNTWRNENEWPLARTVYTSLFLHSSGAANSLNGDGILDFKSPETERHDTYIYEPDAPCPTRGGTGLALALGVYDQRPVENRPDVLVYTSTPSEQNLEITGPLRLELYASSSARDTDFIAKLIDVAPSGYAQNLAEGAIRARYRKSIGDPQFLEAGMVYKLDIDLVATSHVFLRGHSIRLEITSSNFPRYDRNPNTGQPLGSDSSQIAAVQKVFHDVAHPSHLRLPIIPISK